MITDQWNDLAPGLTSSTDNAKIMDILNVRDGDDTEEDLGFGALRFNAGKGHGYTSLSVEAFVFRGSIGFYKLDLDSSSKNWPRIRQRIIQLWKAE